MLRILRARTLQWYIFREFAVSFALALAACTLFILLFSIFNLASDYEEFNVSVGQLTLMFPYLLPKPLAYAVPLAALIASTMVFGRMSAENEIIAAQAGGSPLRIMALPLFFSGVLLSCFCLWCNQGALKWGFGKIRNEILHIDNNQFFENLEKPNNSVSMKLEGSGIVRINWLPFETDPETKKVKRPIHIAYFQNQTVGQTVFARDYHADYSTVNGERVLRLTLKDAQIFGERSQAAANASKRPDMADMQSLCGEFTMELNLPQPSSIISIGETRGQKGWLDNWESARLIKDSYKKRHAFLMRRAGDFGAFAFAGRNGDAASPVLLGQAWSDVRASADALYGAGSARDRALAEETECYRKIGLSILPLSMVVLGIGLGLLVQKSQRMIGFLLGILVYALIYYPLMIASKELSRANMLGLWALFLPNIVLLLLGYGLWRAYERGALSGMVATVVRLLFLDKLFLLVVRPFKFLWSTIGVGVQNLTRYVTQQFFALVFGKRADGYVTGSFIVPLLVVLLSVSVVLTALDFVEHGPEVIDGILKAAEPLAGPVRTYDQAVLDVVTFYAIRSLEVICDMLPLLILIAGLLCVYALVRNNEHLILKSSGVPLQRAFRPIIISTLLFSVAVTGLRETVMPSLIMARDYLRPLVYHRNPAPTALALHTIDSEGKPVLFQMSHYTAAQREGTNIRIYHLTKDERMPYISAERARWNGFGWALEKGYVITARSAGQGVRPVQNSKTPTTEWRGAVTPAYLECDRLGTGVMSLNELQDAMRIKPEMAIEWWRRISEWTMGVFLLWLTIPLLVSEARGPLIGVALSILTGALCWGLNMSCTQAANANFLPTWGPLIPPMLFLILGARQFYFKMAT